MAQYALKISSSPFDAIFTRASGLSLILLTLDMDENVLSNGQRKHFPAHFGLIRDGSSQSALDLSMISLSSLFGVRFMPLSLIFFPAISDDIVNNDINMTD